MLHVSIFSHNLSVFFRNVQNFIYFFVVTHSIHFIVNVQPLYLQNNDIFPKLQRVLQNSHYAPQCTNSFLGDSNHLSERKTHDPHRLSENKKTKINVTISQSLTIIKNGQKQTFFKIYGASTFNLHRLLVTLRLPSSDSLSSTTSQSKTTGI